MSVVACQISSELAYFVAQEGQKISQILLYFQLCHCVVAPPSVVEKTLNTNVELFVPAACDVLAPQNLAR